MVVVAYIFLSMIICKEIIVNFLGTAMIDAILDPSVILEIGGIEKFIRLAEEHKGDVEIYLPSVFFSADTLSPSERTMIFNFFKSPWSREPDLNLFPDVDSLGEIRNVRDAPDFETHLTKHSEFLRSLRDEVTNENIYRILEEEWVFMNEYSFIASKTRAGFNRFMKAGASYLIIGKKSMDRCLAIVVNRANGTALDSPLEAYSIFRASCKYIAAGGASIGTTVISGGIGIGVAAASGLFLVMDP